MDFLIWVERIFAVVIIIFGITGLFVVSSRHGKDYRPRFVYYTNLSNAFVVLYELLLLVSGFVPALASVYGFLSGSIARLCVMLCIFNTFIIYHFVLTPAFKMQVKKDAEEGKEPTRKPVSGQKLSNICVHYIVPLLTVAQWLLVADKAALRYIDAVVWLVIPFAYMFFILIRAPFINSENENVIKYPYFFMDVDKLGWGKFVLIVLGLMVCYLALGLLMVAVGKGLLLLSTLL